MGSKGARCLIICLLTIAVVTSAVADVACPENEAITGCPGPCSFCKYAFEPCPIRVRCETGCDCIQGHHRNSEGKCVRKDQCENAYDCPHNEEPECEQPKSCVTCDHKEPCPTFYCNPGCNCKKGYYRNKFGICIEKYLCDKQDVVCPENEAITGCPGPCSSCKYAKKPCNVRVRCETGCDCIQGHHRNSEGKCVPKNQCEKDGAKCQKDEQYYDCIPGCTNTCETYGIQDRILCLENCTSGCYCKQGLVKRKDGKCVPYEDCPDDVCPEGERPRECASPCNTCEKKGHCDDDCRPACDCKEGYYKNSEGECIPEAECPNKECKENENYECGVACPKRCDNLNIKIKCVGTCVNGCFCKPGLVRSRDGECVKPEDCPADVCPENEVPSGCVRRCEYCDNQGMDCEMFACDIGCQCEEGYYRNAGGHCIPEDQCPQQCKENEDYECGVACPKTCDNLNIQISCVDKCVNGCFCKPGLVRSRDGECVKPEECPADVCPENEVPSSCVPRCETCDNQGVDCEMFACNIGCQCKEGYYRNAEGQCIPQDQCPQM